MKIPEGLQQNLSESLEKIIVVAWSTWSHRNNVSFKNGKLHPTHIINLTISICNDGDIIMLFQVI